MAQIKIYFVGLALSNVGHKVSVFKPNSYFRSWIEARVSYSVHMEGFFQNTFSGGGGIQILYTTALKST